MNTKNLQQISPTFLAVFPRNWLLSAEEAAQLRQPIDACEEA